MNIELVDDQIDEVVLFEMQRHSKILESSLDSLKKRKKTLRKFETEDLKRFEEVLKAMKVMISYYGSHLSSGS